MTTQDMRSSDLLTRIIDILIATAALILFSPMILLIVAAILIETGRPFFFQQVRFGRHGRPFRILKFRKFRQKSGPSGLPLTLANDGRMTRVGAILASTKMDELPQLVNVLRGEMSIVGPRPESTDFEDCFTPGNRALLDYRPGLLGPSQVAFRNECDLYPKECDPTVFYREVLFPLKARVDLAYYPTRNLGSDLRWIFTGVLAVMGLHHTPMTGMTDLELIHHAGGAHTPAPAAE